MRGTAPRWRREFALVAVLYLAYELSRGVAAADSARAVSTGRAILTWETTWHCAPELWLNRLFDSAAWLAVPASYFYSVMHYVITPAVLIWMHRSHPTHYRGARTTLALSTALGVLGFVFLPTAPPRLVPGDGIVDTLARFASWGWWSNHGSVPRGLGGVTNQFAAMPSLHVGWALWSGYLLYRYGRRGVTRVLGVLYPVGTTLVVLGTGNHYLLDVLAGGALWLLAHCVAGRVGRWRHSPRAPVTEQRRAAVGAPVDSCAAQTVTGDRDRRGQSNQT